MDDTTRQKVEESPEERKRRIRRQRMIQERRRRRRRKTLILRGILVLIFILILVGIGSAVSCGVKKYRQSAAGKKDSKKQETQVTEEAVQMEAVDLKKVLHLSFESLIADTDQAFGQEDSNAAATLDQTRVTVDEFNAMLGQLYEEGYVLVRFSDLAAVNEDGAMEAKKLMLPSGKKPLLLSETNVNYDLELSGQGLSSRLVLDGNGALTCEGQASDGSTVTGAFDVVPCVEAFIQEHPDFSNNGARGILGLTGYNGILGYRTDDALATSTDNRYAAKYGVFDTAAEKEAAAPVIEALKSAGWEFACNGYDGTTYGSDEEAVSADLTKWNESVGTLVGNTTILLFPSGTDSRGWKAYDESDPVYQILKKQGFLYYGSMDISGTKTQLTEQYLRCSYMNVDGYRMYQDLYKDAGRFTGILDFQEIYDSKRPMAANETDTQATGGEDEKVRKKCEIWQIYFSFKEKYDINKRYYAC